MQDGDAEMPLFQATKPTFKPLEREGRDFVTQRRLEVSSKAESPSLWHREGKGVIRCHRAAPWLSAELISLGNHGKTPNLWIRQVDMSVAGRPFKLDLGQYQAQSFACLVFVWFSWSSQVWPQRASIGFGRPEQISPIVLSSALRKI